MDKFEAYEKAHRRYAREYPLGDYPCGGGKIDKIGKHEFVVLANGGLGGRVLAAYEIRGERLHAASDAAFAAIERRDWMRRRP